VESIAGKHIELSTKRVTFSYDLDGIAKFGPFARLRFVSQSIYGSTSLEVSVNWEDKPLYRYKVDGLLIDDPKAANAFIGQMLDLALGQSDEFKRKVLTAYDQMQPTIGKESSQALVATQLKQIVELNGYFSAQELKLTQAMLATPALFDLSLPFETELAPQQLQFFNAMAISDSHTASFSELGSLHITHKRPNNKHLNIQYNLNNKRFLQLFLVTTEQAYQPGHSEKAMVNFLVRLHFAMPNEQIRWLEE
jgi:hypothetical protein